MKPPVVLSFRIRQLLGFSLTLLLLLGMGSQILAAPAALPEPRVLARVEVTGMVDALGLPVYAHLQDAAGHDYALVIAPLTQLKQAGATYRILDQDTRGAAYAIAIARQAGARQRAAQLASVLHDDGRQIILRAAPRQTDALVEAGLDIQWLDDTPMVLSAPKTMAAAGTLAITYDPTVAEMIGKVSQSTLFTYDGNLSGESSVTIGGSSYTISTRYTNSGTPIQKATQYVYEFMQSKGLSVSYHNWTSGSYSNRNVIGVKTGTTRPSEIVLVTAHLDDVPSSGSAPGADDNASGSTGVMVAADILTQYQFERTVRLVFFTGEEQGLLGSKAYATQVYNAGDNIVAVYNMDMIAWDSTNGPTLRIHTRTTSSSGYPGDLALANTFVDVVNAYNLSSSLTPIIDKDGITASDHSPFWSKGYSAILAIEDDESDFDAYYHKSTDKRSTLNMTYFTNYAKASIGTIAHLAYPSSGTPPVTIFSDDFETNKGWAFNPSGTDTATTGMWERGDPEATSSSGAKQLGTTVSGVNDLVTGRLAGSGAGSYDVDGGVTSVRSPAITLSGGTNYSLSFSYYFAHGSNSSSADYFRVKVVTSSGATTVFEELGAANNDDAAWTSQTISLNSYAGQTINIQFEAADTSTASLVEAAVDDVKVTRQ